MSTTSAGSSIRPAGLQTFGRTKDQCALAPQKFNVAARCRVAPHGGVHGGHKGDRRASGADQCARKVVGDAASGLGNQIGCCRHDEQQVTLAVDVNVRHRAFGTRLPLCREHRRASERFECERRDELRGVFGHDDAHMGTSPHQCAGCFAAFICGDAARNDKSDALVLEHEPIASIALKSRRSFCLNS